MSFAPDSSASVPRREIGLEQEAEMRAQTIANRVEILERKVEGFEQVPNRLASLELQILQFREEVRVEFSAVRGEMKELHGVAMSRVQQLDNRMHELHDTAMTRMHELHDTAMTRMRVLHDTAMTQMRVLHEEVISRIALLGEGGPRKRRPRR